MPTVARYSQRRAARSARMAVACLRWCLAQARDTHGTLGSGSGSRSCCCGASGGTRESPGGEGAGTPRSRGTSPTPPPRPRRASAATLAASPTVRAASTPAATSARHCVRDGKGTPGEWPRTSRTMFKWHGSAPQSQISVRPAIASDQALPTIGSESHWRSRTSASLAGKPRARKGQ